MRSDEQALHLLGPEQEEGAGATKAAAEKKKRTWKWLPDDWVPRMPRMTSSRSGTDEEDNPSARWASEVVLEIAWKWSKP